ncbi:hypothetical protein PI124_g16004 [Phytophthora idaei]|nr:hypothetical protein PI125_g16209 [Phytophthora idaei]KAG3142296.1 hypothetical protein PI126_g15102 [Phytophthora idaei]KAG3239054.1 hypothetical protein PI124_g16004 [Phytophthora idaei]
MERAKRLRLHHTDYWCLSKTIPEHTTSDAEVVMREAGL